MCTTTSGPWQKSINQVLSRLGCSSMPYYLDSLIDVEDLPSMGDTVS